MVIEPLDGLSSRAKRCISVDLPEPLLPMIATDSPGIIPKDTPLRALNSFWPLAVLNQSTVQSIANNLRTDWQSLNAITSAYTQQLGNMPFVNFNSGPASSNITSNWSGYAATTTGPYTAVSGRWAIPTVSSSV